MKDNVVHLMVLEELVAFIAIARFVVGAGDTTLWVDFPASHARAWNLTLEA